MMATFSRLWNYERPKHFFVVDVGSNTTIRSLRFSKQHDTYTAISKSSFDLPNREDELDLIRPISEYLRRLLFRYVKEIGRVPQTTLIGLGSHFTFNEITTARRTRPRPSEPLRRDEFYELLRDFVEQARSPRGKGTSYVPAEVLPFRVTLDGYHIPAISRSTRGSVLEVTLLATYALAAYWEELIKLRSMLGGLNIHFIPNQAAIARAVVHVLKVRDALAVKIGAKITEVSLIGDGVLLSTGHFGRGGDQFTAAIHERLRIPWADAERMKQQFGTTLLPAGTGEVVRETLTTATGEWLTELSSYLKRDERFLLPERIYLLGGGARLGMVTEALAGQQWFGDLTFLETLIVERLDGEGIARSIFSNSNPPLEGPEDVALAALASYARDAAVAEMPRL
ncbi:MAG: hypothetical protein AAB844_00755 [Patescibacteria group bacterium]